ncbi:MAG: RNA polymerase factor sigma-54 [Dysgonamonadaceae bacterium]|jgi:RNA polymerase sigma-54 factor|nr:RNA polymerase factor sigma-54 [Dysgonamonadaceae bacterium]
MIRQQLTQKQQQKLSPAQIQQIKMLELNSLEVENRINQELEENPALEELPEGISDSDTDEQEYDQPENKDNDTDDFSLDDYLTEDDIPDYALNQHYNATESRREISYSELESFQEYLLNQLRLKHLSEEKLRIGEYIIGNIDDDGYLRRDPGSLSDDLAFQYGLDVSIDEIREIVELIQQLDPPGIGVADVRECLLLQLRRKEKTPERELAITILKNYFDAFSRKQYDKIIKNLNNTDIKNAIREITLLNPKPGSSWESNMETKMSQITPDFIVETGNGELLFYLPEENTPELRVSREYSDMLKSYSLSSGKENAVTKDAIAFVRQKIDSAKWFIEAVKQRNTTLRQTMRAIIEIQRDFFLSGDESDLKPMKLRDVSELCGYDISTVSRVSNRKYVQTNWGIFPLRFFFSEGITNEEGEEVSVREIKTLLKSFIENEDKSKPLTDDALMIQLKQKGYDMARRTIAKYREQLNIPVARLRKEII